MFLVGGVFLINMKRVTTRPRGKSQLTCHHWVTVSTAEPGSDRVTDPPGFYCMKAFLFRRINIHYTEYVVGTICVEVRPSD